MIVEVVVLVHKYIYLQIVHIINNIQLLLLMVCREKNKQQELFFILETIRVEFYVRNTLQVPLLLSEVQILWKHSLTGRKRKTSLSTENIEDSKEYTNDTLIKQVRRIIEFLKKETLAQNFCFV